MGSASLERLLTQEEVAEKLQVKIRTLQTWRATGRGPVTVRIGQQVRYRQQDVEDWINSNLELPSNWRPSY